MHDVATPQVPVSWGELLDKLSILELKRARITRPEARRNVEAEWRLLDDIAAPVRDRPGLAPLLANLRRINAALWDIEDAIREEEAAGRFEDAFVALARAVYRTNDERAAVKRAINDRLGSALVEEKSYADWGTSLTPPAR